LQEIRALQMRLAMALQGCGHQHAHVNGSHAWQMHPGMTFATNAHVPANQDERPAATALVARRELSAAFQECPADVRTTVRIANLPKLYCHEELLLELDYLMSPGSFDFVFLHTNKKLRGENRGYAFVNCSCHAAAMRAFAIVTGHIWQKHQGLEILVASVSWAEVQGLTANLKMRKASMMKQMTPKKGRSQAKKSFVRW